MLYALSSPITQTDTNRDGLRLEQLLTNLPFLSAPPKSHTASLVGGGRHIKDVAHPLTAGSDIRRVYGVGLKTADHRRPPPDEPQTTIGRHRTHRRTQQDAENNFISFQTWFHVKIKH